MSDTIFILGVDGYIGIALAQRFLRKGYNVIGIDNLLKRDQLKEQKEISAIPINNFTERKKFLKKLGNYKQYKLDIVENDKDFYALLVEHEPTAIFNLAHIPSAPYSMINMGHANFTLMNNIIGTNSLLWMIRQICPDCHYITIGTTGEYAHDANIDIEEGYFQINYKGRESKELIYPREGNSIYHCSKISSTYITEYLSRIWDLKCTDIMQSVVYGAYTDEIDKTGIETRLSSSDCNGTVINRFTVQAAIGNPLTVFGEGKHQRGFISLNDSIQALEIAFNNEPEPGRARVWNQLSEWYSMNELAEMVKKVGKRQGLEVNIDHIKSPRPEYTGEHYYYYNTEILQSLGYKPTRSIEQEVAYTMSKIDTTRSKKLKDLVEPKVIWR